MELEIFYLGRPVGRMTIEQQGLYYRISAECRPQTQAVLRLYLISGLHCRSLGAMLYENGQFRLKTCLSHHLLAPEKLTAAVVGQAHGDGFCPWRGELDGAVVDHALLSEQEGLTLALKETEDFPLLGWLPYCRRTSLDGEDYLTLRLTPDGRPEAQTADSEQAASAELTREEGAYKKKAPEEMQEAYPAADGREDESYLEV